MYALPAPRSGCPKGWGKGRRDQSSGGDIDVSTSITRALDIRYGRIISTSYCVKDETNTDLGIGFDWPGGKYCIARKENFCPSPEFAEGSITWNDRKSFIRKNDNAVWGKLPDGVYDKNTKIYFCCRNNGRYSDPIQLPTEDPFVLYRYGGQCQNVTGATFEEHFIKFDKSSDIFSTSKCEGAHPDDDDCDKYHKLHFCYYHKK